MTSAGRLCVLATLAALCASPAHAQFTLGQQRAGTASGTFLKIGVGARATGLGESFVAVANDPSAIYWNPAGLASIQRQEVALSHIDWPAEIRFEHMALVFPVRRLGGSLAFQFGVLTTTLDETSELQPFGTGRTFVYSDMIMGAAYARRWTDKLLVGVGAKYMREDLGKDVGNPTTTAVLFDIGSIYYLGLGSVRVATSLSNFSPELKPKGEYLSLGPDGTAGTADDEVRSYDGFDAPTVFRYGVAFEPIERAGQRVTTSIEANQPADNAQAVKAGLEWVWLDRLALRTGYNFNADALKFSAGAGVNAELGGLRATVDYAYTDGGFLGPINRLTLGVRF
ncbi:MAG TPA: PorV/PorQ family protein [Candidatus Eisenbacteria bacterium]|nr:PorV/PorQ family protein [Candidatus Eisenbacteria bacterium]